MSHSGLAKNSVEGMFTCDILPQKVFKIENSGVDEQSIHLEIRCHRGHSETLRRCVGWMFRECLNITY
jgi:hypothetical protein